MGRPPKNLTQEDVINLAHAKKRGGLDSHLHESLEAEERAYEIKRCLNENIGTSQYNVLTVLVLAYCLGCEDGKRVRVVKTDPIGIINHEIKLGVPLFSYLPEVAKKPLYEIQKYVNDVLEGSATSGALFTLSPSVIRKYFNPQGHALDSRKVFDRPPISLRAPIEPRTVFAGFETGMSGVPVRYELKPEREEYRDNVIIAWNNLTTNQRLQPVKAGIHQIRELASIDFLLTYSRALWGITPVEPPHYDDTPSAGFCFQDAIKCLGAIVGSCKEAEEMAMEFLNYLVGRLNSGVRREEGHLRHCLNHECPHEPFYLGTSDPAHSERLSRAEKHDKHPQGSHNISEYCAACEPEKERIRKSRQRLKRQSP